MTCNIHSSTLFLLSLSLIHLFLFSVFVAFHISSFFHSPCSHSIYHCLTALHFYTSPPLLSIIAYVANQNKFPLRTLNIIGSFQSSSRLLLSPSICCPDPKSDMGFMKRVHTTENVITACSSRLPSFSLLIQSNMGLMRRAHPSHWSTSALSPFPFPSPLFLPYFQSRLFHFSSSLVLLYVIATSVSLFLCHLYFTPRCSEVILSPLSRALFIIIFILFSLSLSHTHLSLRPIHTNSVCISVALHLNNIIIFGCVDGKEENKEETADREC